jgi:transposase
VLVVAHHVQIYLYAKDVDMRRSFDGLFAIVQAELQRDIRNGDYFLFLSKRRDRIKILWWDKDGLAIFAKRLEAGTFQRIDAQASGQAYHIDQAQLTMLLSGIDMSNIKRRKRYSS